MDSFTAAELMNEGGQRETGTVAKALRLPVELVRLILEFAASRSQVTAADLTCVSKTVQGWIAPILYQTVILLSSNAVLSFYETIQISKSQFASHVRALYLPSAPCPGVPPSFLTNFPALQYLTISSLSLRDPPQPLPLPRPLPRPTSIAITGPLGRISFEHSIFQRCTHLYLADDVPAPFALTSEMLPCLTHLACAYRHGSSSTTAITCLPLLLSQPANPHIPSQAESPPIPHSTPRHTSPVELKVLVLELYLSNGSPDATMFVVERLGLGKKVAESDLRADPRVVLRPGKALTPQRWETYILSNAFWIGAEREIKMQTVLKTR